MPVILQKIDGNMEEKVASGKRRLPKGERLLVTNQIVLMPDA